MIHLSEQVIRVDYKQNMCNLYIYTVYSYDKSQWTGQISWTINRTYVTCICLQYTVMIYLSEQGILVEL